MKTQNYFLILALIALAALVGCGKKTKTAAAKLSFSNSNAVAMNWLDHVKEWIFPKAFAAATSAPTEFKMKVIAAYLSEDVDPVTQNNLGMNAMFYVNPECGEEDLMRCNVGPGIAEDGKPYTNIVTTFFDFAQGTDAVNAALNAQSRDIEPGTYRYVRLDFCKGGTGGVPNTSWAGGNVVAETYFSTGMCGVTSVVMDPPLVIAEGDSVTIQLNYDYSAAIQTGADAIGWDCVGAGATKTCFNVPDFVPSALQ